MVSAGNECSAHAPKQPTHPATLDERSLHRNLEAACHSSIVHILGFFYALSLGQIAAKRGGKPLLFLRYVGLFSFRVDLVWWLFGHSQPETLPERS
jgi:hypothetical protein